MNAPGNTTAPTGAPTQPERPAPLTRADLFVAGLVALGLVVLLLPAVHMDVDQHHDGIMLKPALDLLSGQVLFRETFMQYGALTAYLQAAALWFHPSLETLRFMTVGAYVVTLAFLYAAWRQILPRSLTVLSCGLFMLFIPTYETDWMGGHWVLLPWSSVLALMFQAVALHALFNVIRDVRPGRGALILGMACAAIVWCRQPVGVIMIGSVGAIWIALHLAGWTPASTSKGTLLRRLLAGHLLVHALLFGSVVITRAVPEWWYQNFVWPGKMVGTLAHKLHFALFLRPSAAAGLLLLLLAVSAPGWLPRCGIQINRRRLAIYYAGLAVVLVWQHERVLRWLDLREGGWSVLIPLAIVAQACICLAPVFRRRSAPLPTDYYLVAALAALAAGSVLQYYPLPDPWHVVWALGPGFGLAVHSFWRGSRWPAVTTTLVLVAALVPAVLGKAQSIRQSLARPLVTIERPAMLHGMRVSAAFAERLDRITTLVEQVERQRPGIPSVLIGHDALFTCFTKNLTNPSPYFVTWVGLTEPAENERRWAYIHAVRPLMFLHGARWDAVGDFYRKAHYVPVVYFADDALEIAVPEEIADALGITTYGAPKKSAGANPPP